MTPVEIHNRDVADIVRRIFLTATEDGGGTTAVLALLESVCVGVMALAVSPDVDNDEIYLLSAGVRQRMAEIRRRQTENPKPNLAAQVAALGADSLLPQE